MRKKEGEIKRHIGGPRELAAGNAAAEAIIEYLNLLLKLGHANGKTSFQELVEKIESGEVWVLSEFEFGAGGIHGFKFFEMRDSKEPVLICDVMPTQKLNS